MCVIYLSTIYHLLLFIHYLELIAGVVASEHDLGNLIANSLAPVQQLRVMVQHVELARVIHKLLIPGEKRKEGGIRREREGSKREKGKARGKGGERGITNGAAYKVWSHTTYVN